jgi:hypothetical protein
MKFWRISDKGVITDWLYLKPLIIPYFKHLGSSLLIVIELDNLKGMGMDKRKGEYLVCCGVDGERNSYDNKLV